MNNGFYFLQEKEANERIKNVPSICDFCSMQVKDKTAHLLESECLRVLENAIIEYRKLGSAPAATPAVTPAATGSTVSDLQRSKEESAFTKSDSLVQQTSDETEKAKSRWICLLCRKTVSCDKTHFEEHEDEILREVRLKTDHFQCQWCGAVLSCRQTLKNHIRCRHKTQDILVEENSMPKDWANYTRPVTCEICKKICESFVNLRIHCRQVHKGKMLVQKQVPPANAADTARKPKKSSTILKSEIAKLKKVSTKRDSEGCENENVIRKKLKMVSESNDDDESKKGGASKSPKALKSDFHKTAEKRFIGECVLCQKKMPNETKFQVSFKV